MRRKRRSKPLHNQANAEKELRSLSSTQSVIRILNCVSASPRNSVEIGQRLRSNSTTIDSASLKRTLLRLRRHRWLTAKKDVWSLTPAGRKAFKFALAGLKDLVHLTRQ